MYIYGHMWQLYIPVYHGLAPAKMLACTLTSHAYIQRHTHKCLSSGHIHTWISWAFASQDACMRSNVAVSLVSIPCIYTYIYTHTYNCSYAYLYLTGSRQACAPMWRYPLFLCHAYIHIYIYIYIYTHTHTQLLLHIPGSHGPSPAKMLACAPTWRCPLFLCHALP